MSVGYEEANIYHIRAIAVLAAPGVLELGVTWHFFVDNLLLYMTRYVSLVSRNP
jgi:hypothetical protein